MATSLTRDETKWAGSVNLTSKSKTLTLNTADKYVDKDIELTITAKEGSCTISGGSLTHGPITTTDKTYLTGTSTTDGYKVTITNDASVEAISANITEGWLANGDIAAKPVTNTDTVSKDFYVKKGAASITAGQSIPVSGSITNNNGTLTATLNGSKTINGSATAGWVTSVTGASVSASGKATAKATDLDENLKAENIVQDVTIFGVTGTGPVTTPPSFTNTGAEGATYKDVSTTAPVLKSGDYLYISKGYVSENQKISLSQLVPNGSNVTGKKDLIYKTISAYDNDGNLVAGTMDDATIKSGAPSVSGTPTVGAKTSGKYPLTAKINVAAPSVTAGGYITTSNGTKNTNSGNVVINLDAATCAVAGGGLTSGAGSTSVSTDGLVGAAGAIDATEKIALSTTSATGYYKITSSGSGIVNRAAITDAHTAGWLEAKTASTVSDATSLSSNTAKQEYFIKKSAGGSQTVTPKTTDQSVTIGAGYYPTDRTITVAKVNPADSSQVAQGTLSAEDSAISSVTASAGTATVDATKFEYNIPLTLSASGTAHAKVSAAGYVTAEKDTSKNISGTGSANIVLDLYNGAFSWS